jgi:hypothetical protein
MNCARCARTDLLTGRPDELRAMRNDGGRPEELRAMHSDGRRPEELHAMHRDGGRPEELRAMHRDGGRPKELRAMLRVRAHRRSESLLRNVVRCAEAMHIAKTSSTLA